MATPALTDLQRIELAFPAAAMLHVLDHAADAADPRVGRIRAFLVGTVDEVLTDLSQHQSRKLRSRLDRVLRTFLSPLTRARGRVDAVGLIAWRVLEAVLEADILVLPEDTPLSRALAAMRPALRRAAREPQVAIDVAREWPKALRRLQALGLYGDVGSDESVAA